VFRLASSKTSFRDLTGRPGLPWLAAVVIAFAAVLVIVVRGWAYVPGAALQSDFCTADIGSELERGGHSEEVLWRGCLIASDPARAVPRLIHRSRAQSCLACHDGVRAPLFAELWTRFPRVNAASGELEDLATAIRREIVLRYDGVMPNKADNAVTALYFYMAAKARQAGKTYVVDDPAAAAPADAAARAALGFVEPDCRRKFDEKGWPVGANAPYVAAGCNLVVNPLAHLAGPIVRRWPTEVTCQSCHRDVGDRANAASIGHGAVALPHMMTSMSQPIRFDRRVLMCFARSLDSFDLGLDAREITRINVYANWLAQKAQLPIGVLPPGRGIPILYDALGKGQSFLAGEHVYSGYCQPCHGFAGNGGAPPVDGRVAPPIAGPQSFTRAASTAEAFRLAGFVQANMPPGASREQPVLSDQQALDVAAYLTQLGRPADFTKRSPLEVFGNWLWVRTVTATAGAINRLRAAGEGS
jgi:thiosulfate dehydrogenase